MNDEIKGKESFGVRFTGTPEEQQHEMLTLILHTVLATRAKLDALLRLSLTEMAKDRCPADLAAQQLERTRLANDLADRVAQRQERLLGQAALDQPAEN